MKNKGYFLQWLKDMGGIKDGMGQIIGIKLNKIITTL